MGFKNSRKIWISNWTTKTKVLFCFVFFHTCCYNVNVTWPAKGHVFEQFEKLKSWELFFRDVQPMRCRVILVTFFFVEAIKYPDKATLGRRGLFGLPLQGCNPSQWESWGGRGLNHLVALCLQSGGREMDACAQATSSSFCVPGAQPREHCYTQ